MVNEFNHFQNDWFDRGWKTEFSRYHEAADNQIRQPLWVQFPLLHGETKKVCPIHVSFRDSTGLQLGRATRVRTVLIGSSMHSTIPLSSGVQFIFLCANQQTFAGLPQWRSSWWAMRCWPTHKEISLQSRYNDVIKLGWTYELLTIST